MKVYKYFVCYLNKVNNIIDVYGDVLIERKGVLKDEADINDLREWVKQKSVADIQKKNSDFEVRSANVTFTSITEMKFK
jgi:hypothetical protein